MIWFDEISPYERLKGKKIRRAFSDLYIGIHIHIYTYVYLHIYVYICVCINIIYIILHRCTQERETDRKTHTCWKKIPLLLFSCFLAIW